jgi:hypothetical protein
MTVATSWYAQPFRPDGGITGEGLLNQLGRPSLSLLTVLTRESAQNSWDARGSDAAVDFTMALGTVGPAQLAAWRDWLGSGLPVGPAFPLRQVLRRPTITYLAVSDRGTMGLGGPTRSDLTTPDDRRNWLSFVLNSGEARDTEGGGGTYGYGKGIFYLVSRPGAVLIHTRFRDDGRLRTRLIGAALGPAYDVREVPYTGRHWWGVPQGDHCEPLVDAEAERCARALGLPDFTGNQTGTTVVVIDPALPDPSVPEETDEQFDLLAAGRFLAEAIGWNLWPLMAPGRSQRLVPRVTVDGRPVPVPDCRSDAVLAEFTEAFERLRTDGDDLWCGRPRRLLGRFAHRPTFGATTGSVAARELGVEGAPHHVCLLREPDLVVRYVKGPETAHQMIGYAGVVKVDPGLDEVFARAEPPTHDAWIDTQLRGTDATFVRTLHTRIRERWSELAGQKRIPTTVSDLPVAGIAKKLGHLFSGAVARSAAGPAATASPGVVDLDPAGSGPAGFTSFLGGSGPSPGRRRQRVRLDGTPTFVDGDHGTTLEQRVHLPPGEFAASVHVVIGDGGVEPEPYAGAGLPRVLYWRRTDGSVHGGDRFRTDEPAECVVVVDPVADAALRITVEAVG